MSSPPAKPGAKKARSPSPKSPAPKSPASKGPAKAAAAPAAKRSVTPKSPSPKPTGKKAPSPAGKGKKQPAAPPPADDATEDDKTETNTEAETQSTQEPTETPRSLALTPPPKPTESEGKKEYEFEKLKEVSHLKDELRKLSDEMARVRTDNKYLEEKCALAESFRREAEGKQKELHDELWDMKRMLAKEAAERAANEKELQEEIERQRDEMDKLKSQLREAEVVKEDLERQHEQNIEELLAAKATIEREKSSGDRKTKSIDGLHDDLSIARKDIAHFKQHYIKAKTRGDQAKKMIETLQQERSKLLKTIEKQQAELDQVFGEGDYRQVITERRKKEERERMVDARARQQEELKRMAAALNQYRDAENLFQDEDSPSPPSKQRLGGTTTSLADTLRYE